MKIVDLGEYSMAIKDGLEDSHCYRKIEDIYNYAKNNGISILVDKGNQLTYHYLVSSDYLCSAGILLLYFIDKIPSKYQVGDRVYVTTPGIY